MNYNILTLTFKEREAVRKACEYYTQQEELEQQKCDMHQPYNRPYLIECRTVAIGLRSLMAKLISASKQ